MKDAKREDLMGKLPHEDAYPLGRIVAVVDLEETFKVASLSSERNIIIGAAGEPANLWTTSGWALRIPPADFALGDLSPGRCGWMLGNVRALKTPIPCRGYQCLFEVPPDVEAKVQEQLAAALAAAGAGS